MKHWKRTALTLVLVPVIGGALATASPDSDCDTHCERDYEDCLSAYAAPSWSECQSYAAPTITDPADPCKEHREDHIASCMIGYGSCTVDCSTDVGDTGFIGGDSGWSFGDTGSTPLDTGGVWYGGGGGGPSMSGFIGSGCPDGTTLNPLGLCVPTLDGETPEDSDPEDPCGPGFTLGPDGGCVPEIDLVPADIYSIDGSTWWATCLPPLVPGPADGCVIDTSEEGGGEGEDPCGSPLALGPTGRCGPDLDTALGREALARLVQQLTEAERLDEEGVRDTLARYGAVELEDLDAGLSRLREVATSTSE